MASDRSNFGKLAALSSIYVFWGAIASLNDLLIPYLKDEFALSYAQAGRVQLVFYAAYFFLSLPFGLVVRRQGFRNGILIGLTGAISGCLLMVAAPRAGTYAFFLVALFVLASGITMLQVAANPYATSLGPERTAPSRLTLVQSFHSLGTTLGPFVGAILIFSVVAQGNYELAPSGTSGAGVVLPYAFLALMLASVAWIFRRIEHGRTPAGAIQGKIDYIGLVMRNPRLAFSLLGIFFYVGAEIAIGSYLVNFLGEQHIAGLGPDQAGKLVSVYWGCALLGRFAGAVILRFVAAGRLLVIYAAIAASMVAVSVNCDGALAMWSILLVGFFNSIMFPSIFALTIRGFPAEPHAVSGILCLGIVGGAVISQLQGMLADQVGIQASYSLPMLCYLYILVFAFIAFARKPLSHGHQESEG